MKQLCILFPQTQNWKTLLSKLLLLFRVIFQQTKSPCLFPASGHQWGMRSRKKSGTHVSFLIGKPAFKYWQIFKPTFNGLNIYLPLPTNLVELRTAAECPIRGECPVLRFLFSFVFFAKKLRGFFSSPPFHLLLVIITFSLDRPGQ